MKKGNRRLVERPKNAHNKYSLVNKPRTFKYILKILEILNKYIRLNKLILFAVLLLLIPKIEGQSNESDIQNVLLKEKKCFTPNVRQEREIKIEDVDGEDEDDVDLDPDSVEYVSETIKKTCNSCRMREEVRTISLQAIRADILSKLGMTTVPNITFRVDDPMLTRLLQRIENEKQPKHPYSYRKYHHSSNGISWVNPDDVMMGDEPVESDFSDKHRSQLYYSDRSKHKFEEGEVIIDEEDDFHIKTEKVITFAQPYNRLRHGGKIEDIQRFQFSDRVRNNRVVRASVWIYVRGRQSRKNNANINISIYRVAKLAQPARDSESPVLHTVIANLKQPLPNGTGAWVNIDYVQIEHLVSDWFKNPQNNLGIVIRAEDEQEKNLAVTSHTSHDSSKVPFLEVHVTDSKKHRTKRTTVGLNCHDSSNETKCCRYPLTVDFEEFGWDWIIAPKKYDANYCSGDCPYVYMTRYPHTHIVQQANLPRGGPCCAPRKLSPISMLYFDNNNNIIYGTLPSMVVDRCGCT